MIPSAWFPYVLIAHISFAISLFLPSFLLPFTMRTRTRDGEPVQAVPGRFVRGLLWLERNGTTVIGIGVLVTGLMMLGILGSAFAGQPWLLAGIAIYAGVLIVSFFIQRPGLRTLLRISKDATPEEQARWRARAMKQRYISYGMAAAVGVIGWLMMAKPGA
jgi:hypothetical protein